MKDRIPQRSSPLEDQVVDILIERIAGGRYTPQSRLPSESELAKEFTVSRTTIRGALSTLAADGLVKRRHGVGTFVSQLTQISNPLNEVVDYRELIEGQGFEFDFQHIGAHLVTPDSKVRKMLALDPESSALQVIKAFTADDELLIYTTNVIPQWVFEKYLTPEEVTRPGATEPLFEFFETLCGQPIEDFHAVVRPEIAQNIQMDNQAPAVSPLLPVLVIEEVGYNSHGRAVLYEIENLFGDRMKFELARRYRRPAH
jgi:GntR family transcriptional regulator